MDLKGAIRLQNPALWAIEIRPMEEKDLERVQEIDQQSFSLPWPGRAFCYELKENPHALLWVAEVSPLDGTFLMKPESGGAQDFASEIGPVKSFAQISSKRESQTSLVVGMIVVWMVLDEAHIATLAVDPQYRGLGVASRLLETSLQAAMQRNASQATLEVRAGNQAALALYRRFGFEVVGRRPRYYKDNNEDALIMTRDLKGDSIVDRG